MVTTINSLMAYYNYYYHQPWPPHYLPDPWRTTLVPHHFPEHHYPLEKTRHALSGAFSAIGHTLAHPLENDPPIHCPRADIKESEKFYYIDVELPGVEGKEKVKLKWLSARTLLLQAYTKRQLADEEADEVAAKPEQAEADQAKGSQPEKAKVFVTMQERQVGSIARAFNFPTSVDHAALSANLQHGLLTVKVPKVMDEHVKDEHKTPEVRGCQAG